MGFMFSMLMVRAVIRLVCGELGDLLVAKNKAYGNSALQPLRIFSTASTQEQIRVRLDDKLSRLARGSAAGEDVLADLMGYLVLLRVSMLESALGSGAGAELDSAAALFRQKRNEGETDEALRRRLRCLVEDVEESVDEQGFHTAGPPEPVQVVIGVDMAAPGTRDEAVQATFVSRERLLNLARYAGGLEAADGGKAEDPMGALEGAVFKLRAEHAMLEKKLLAQEEKERIRQAEERERLRDAARAVQAKAEEGRIGVSVEVRGVDPAKVEQAIAETAKQAADWATGQQKTAEQELAFKLHQLLPEVFPLELGHPERLERLAARYEMLLNWSRSVHQWGAYVLRPKGPTVFDGYTLTGQEGEVCDGPREEVLLALALKLNVTLHTPQEMRDEVSARLKEQTHAHTTAVMLVQCMVNDTDRQGIEQRAATVGFAQAVQALRITLNEKRWQDTAAKELSWKLAGVAPSDFQEGLQWDALVSRLLALVGKAMRWKEQAEKVTKDFEEVKAKHDVAVERLQVFSKVLRSHEPKVFPGAEGDIATSGEAERLGIMLGEVRFTLATLLGNTAGQKLTEVASAVVAAYNRLPAPAQPSARRVVPIPEALAKPVFTTPLHIAQAADRDANEYARGICESRAHASGGYLFENAKEDFVAGWAACYKANAPEAQ